MSACPYLAGSGRRKAHGWPVLWAESPPSRATLADVRARRRSIAGNTPGGFVAQLRACGNF